jgi:flagellar basal-body rod protein FlgC
MGFEGIMKIAAGGLSAQRARMNVIAENMANVETTRTPDGGPYRRGRVILEATPPGDAFERALGAAERASSSVRISAVERDDDEVRIVHDPGHPDADAQGNVAMPDVSMVEEMTDMIQASRAYEANLFTLRTLRTLAEKALTIGRG